MRQPSQGIDAAAPGQVVPYAPERLPARRVGIRRIRLLLRLAVIDHVPGHRRPGLDHDLHTLDGTLIPQLVEPATDVLGDAELIGIGAEDLPVKIVPDLGKGEGRGRYGCWRLQVVPDQVA